jgi:N6-L-threonylcarbamoyladenine synthase
VILGIETSCDDTCAAVVTGEGEIASNVIASQGLLHARYGGVVPEIASRHHLELVDAVTADALERAGTRLDDIDTVAVTRGPGLIGALLVGLSSAKALAATRELPLVPVDHLHGHVVASTLGPDPVQTPYLALVASGGHTFLARVDHPSAYSVLGQTLDDAAGEAFDKGARLLGLGYPGGPAIDRLAREGDPEAFDFPRSAPGELDFSFSGLKTALLYVVRDLGEGAPARAADLAASYQRAIVDALVGRTRAALRREGLDRLAIGGGVAANSELRAAVEDLGVAVWVPSVELCTDNAAMIAGAARFLEPLDYPRYLVVADRARVAQLEQLLALGVVELVHQAPPGVRAILEVLAVAVLERAEAPLPVVEEVAGPAHALGADPVGLAEVVEPGEGRLRHAPPRERVLLALLAAVIEAEPVDKGAQRQPLADQRHEDHRER